jgi:deoxyribose-phosphate aldolase
MDKNIIKRIDHTNLDLKAKAKDIIKTCNEAKKYGFRGVCVNPEWVKLVSKELKGTKMKTVVLLDPPIGDSSHKKRVQITKKTKRDGADDLDIVISIPDVKHARWNKILKDLKPICKIGSTKVIIGSGYLTDAEIIKASKIVKQAGAECVKTATWADPLEHRELDEKLHHLKLMKKSAPGLQIKVSGKIKTLSDARRAVKAGADIIGTSSGVQIAQGR